MLGVINPWLFGEGADSLPSRKLGPVCLVELSL